MTDIEAVFFDLHNTTMDGAYSAVGLAHVAPIVSARWGIAPDRVDDAFREGLLAAMATYHTRDFYLMSDVFAAAFGHIASSVGADPDRAELHDAVDRMWDANIPAARPVVGALETMDAIRASGRRVGVVSWADIDVFDRLIEHLEFGDHVDVAVCSEAARSCKPHPGIFRYALDAIGAAPERSMFVGDSIDQDIVGGNRLGMTTVLVDASKYASDIGAFGDDPATVPDHHVDDLREVVELLGGRAAVD